MLLMGKSTISMAIFNSYVSLPEGNPQNSKKITFLLRLHGIQWLTVAPVGGWPTPLKNMS